MNRLFTILLSMILLAGWAQTSDAQSPVNIGLKVGVNIADFPGADYDTDYRQGWTVGAFLELSIPVLPVDVESGIYYSQKGTEASEGGQTGVLRVDYLEVPVMARLNFGPPGPFRPHLLAGPYLGININSEGEISSNGASLLQDFSDETNSTDFGLIFGAGADIGFGVTSFNVQARYSLGLTSVYTDNFDDGEKNGVFSVVVGIGF